MNKIVCRYIVLLALCATAAGTSTAQQRTKIRWGLSTNAAEDIFLLSPNIKANIYAGQRSVFSAGGGYGWWGQNWKRSFQQWNLGSEYHFYIENDGLFLGHHIGVGVHLGQREFHKKNDGQKGHWATAGVLYGYTWHLKNRWFLSAGAGVGYAYKHIHKFHYDDYDRQHRYHCHSHSTRHTFGITSLSISFNHRF